MKPISSGLKNKISIIIDSDSKNENQPESDIEDIQDLEDFQIVHPHLQNPVPTTTHRSSFHRIVPIRKLIEKKPKPKRSHKIQEVQLSDSENQNRENFVNCESPVHVHHEGRRHDLRKRLMKVANKSKIQGKQYCCTECSICLGSLQAKFSHQIGRLQCKHAFCFECILESSKFSNRCPYCRAAYHEIDRNGEHIEVEEKDLEEDFDPYDEPCYVCGRNDDFDHLLECQYCEAAFCHTYCDNRLESDVPPEESWYCLSCSNLLQN